MTDKPTVPCGECDEPITVDANKCPHCGSVVMTTGMWILLAVVGVASSAVVWYTIAPLLPGGRIGAALAVFIFLVVGYGGVKQRRETVRDAEVS